MLVEFLLVRSGGWVIDHPGKESFWNNMYI